MGSKTIKRILRRRQPSKQRNPQTSKRTFLQDRSEERSRDPGKPNDDVEVINDSTQLETNQAVLSNDILKGRRDRLRMGPVTSHSFRERGIQILKQFINTLGAEREASLNRGWMVGGTALQQGNMYSYELRQGRKGEEEKIREAMRGRSYKTGHRLQGGGWTRLVLGNEFTEAASRKQVHELRLVIPYCACLVCRVASAKEEAQDDMDEMLAEAEQGDGFFDTEDDSRSQKSQSDEKESSQQDGLERARARVTFGTLPTVDDLTQLGETLPSHELELGTVSKINSRGGKVTFSPFARQFFQDGKYGGQMSKEEVSEAVTKFALQHYQKYKGKTTRRFYVHGWLCRFAIEGTGAVIFPPSSDGPVGVIFRRQTMLLFRGRLALEDALGSFLETDHEMFIGFGQDSSGAQTIFGDGRVTQARHLGINELRMHCDLDAEKEIGLRMK